MGREIQIADSAKRDVVGGTVTSCTSALTFIPLRRPSGASLPHQEGRAREMVCEMVCEMLCETLCEHPNMRSPKEAMRSPKAAMCP